MRRLGRKDKDILRQHKPLGDPAFGIVVAVKEVDGDLRPRQPAHLLGEEQAGRVIAPVAIVEIAGDDNEIDRVFKRVVDEVGQRLAGAAFQPVDRRLSRIGEAGERGVEVDVGGVDELHGWRSTLGFRQRCLLLSSNAGA